MGKRHSVRFVCFVYTIYTHVHKSLFSFRECCVENQCLVLRQLWGCVIWVWSQDVSVPQDGFRRNFIDDWLHCWFVYKRTNFSGKLCINTKNYKNCRSSLTTQAWMPWQKENWGLVKLGVWCANATTCVFCAAGLWLANLENRRSWWRRFHGLGFSLGCQTSYWLWKLHLSLDFSH